MGFGGRLRENAQFLLFSINSGDIARYLKMGQSYRIRAEIFRSILNWHHISQNDCLIGMIKAKMALESGLPLGWKRRIMENPVFYTWFPDTSNLRVVIPTTRFLLKNLCFSAPPSRRLAMFISYIFVFLHIC